MSDADSEPSVQEVRVIALVSVLDLDNIFVSIAICLIGRGNSPSNTGPKGQQPRSSPNAGRSNMLLVSLFTMSIRLKDEAMLHPGTDVQTHCMCLKVCSVYHLREGGGSRRT